MYKSESGLICITKQTHIPGNTTEGVLSVTLYLVAINGILGNGVDGSLYADDLPIYIMKKNQRVAAKALKGVTNKIGAWAAEKGLTFSTSKTVNIVFSKRRKKKKRTN